jgi:hypothetical protein
MPKSQRKDLLLIGCIGLLFGIIGWVLYGVLFSYVPAQDFIVFYTAARACIEGHLPLIYDGDAFTAQINAQFGGWFNRPLDLHPWVYPPLFLLMVLPLGLLPFTIALALFLTISFVLLNCAIRCYVPRGYQRWVCAASLVLSPATAFTAAVGQNSFMTTGLLVGGFGLMARKPVLAGALLGLLACKPQLWLMVPVALVAARKWNVLAATIATACLFVLISIAVFGIEPWREWLTLMRGQSPLFQRWLLLGRLNGQSLYTDAFLLGASAPIANAIQVIACLLCAGLTWWCFRASAMRADLQLAVLLTTTILAAPHVANYDTVMITVAASLFLCHALTNGFHSGNAMLIVVVWSIELLNPPQMIRWGLITPVVLCVFLAVVIATGRADTALVKTARGFHQPALP